MDSSRYIIEPEIGDIPVFPKFEFKDSDWHDGLLVRTPNWLGDAVMAIPAILALNKILPPGCGLFVAVPKGIVPLFEALPCVDRIVPIADPHAFMNINERMEVKRLQAGAAILFNNSFRDALSLKFSRIPKLFGAKARFRSMLLTQSYEFPKRITAALNKPHQAAKYLAMAQALGASAWDGSLPEFRLNKPPQEFSIGLEQTLQRKKILTIAGGAAYGAAKRWPAESFREVAKRWIELNGGFVAAVGSKSEAAIAGEILQGLPADQSVNLAGKTTLDELMILLKHSDMCIANDSGAMHLAAVLGTPGVAPFGCTDPAATSPISKKWRILFDKKECAPCFKRVCPKGTKECFASITPDLVWETVKNLTAQPSTY